MTDNDHLKEYYDRLNRRDQADFFQEKGLLSKEELNSVHLMIDSKDYSDFTVAELILKNKETEFKKRLCQ